MSLTNPSPQPAAPLVTLQACCHTPTGSGPDEMAWRAIARQRGMFATLLLDRAQIDRLRDDHATYVAPHGLLNIDALDAVRACPPA